MTERPCPNCGNPMPDSPAASCPKCGFAPSAGVIRRHKPHQTRGLEAVARKFGPRWSFASAALMVVVSLIYYCDMATAERTGGSFLADPFSGLIYRVAGKWAVLALWLTCAVFFLLAGLRARKLSRPDGTPR